MVNIKQNIVNLAISTCKHDDFMCQTCMGTAFEGVDSLQVQIINAKRSKCKGYISLENTNN